MLVSAVLAFLAAAVEPAAVAPAQAQAPVAKPKRICHVEEAVTGSLTPKRVCVTVPQAAPAVPKEAQSAPAEKPQQGGASGN